MGNHPLTKIERGHAVQTTRDTEKKRRLLRKALHLFAAEGYAAVGVRRLAEEAGISIGMVRLHFGSKEGLRNQLDDLVIDAIQDLYQHIEIDPDRPDPLQFAQHALQFSSVERDVLLYLRSSLIEQSPRASDMVARLFAICRSWIETFNAKGLIEDGINPDALAKFVLYNLIGPLIIEPYSQDIIGESIYSANQVQARNELLFKAMTTGVLVKHS